jgi:hypothetical protein
MAAGRSAEQVAWLAQFSCDGGAMMPGAELAATRAAVCAAERVAVRDAELASELAAWRDAWRDAVRDAERHADRAAWLASALVAAVAVAMVLAAARDALLAPARSAVMAGGAPGGAGAPGLDQAPVAKVWARSAWFLTAHRKKLLGYDLDEHAADLLAALAGKTRRRQDRLILRFTLRALVKVLDCTRVALRSRLRDEVDSITRRWPRK